MADKDLTCIFLLIPPSQIAYLKFTIESYEGLGIVRTLNPDQGEVVIMAPIDSSSTLLRLLEGLSSELELQVITPPLGSINEDWLLSEYFAELDSNR